MSTEQDFESQRSDQLSRRDFVKKTAAAAGLSAGLMHSDKAEAVTSARAQQRTFTLSYAPHFGTFRHLAGPDPLAQLRFAADHGFTAWEVNGMKGKSVELQRKIVRTMEQLDMRMGVFVANRQTAFSGPTLTSGKPGKREQFLSEIRESVEVAKRVNATWMTVVPGSQAPKLRSGYQRANVVESLRRAAAILEPHGLVMVLEPLNPYTTRMPTPFLQFTAQAYAICKAVNSASCKILYDIYHQQITEGNLIPNIDGAWDEIAYFQIGDNPGRNEPTTGEINFENIFEHIHGKGYNGILGMEHGVSKPGVAGERALIEAYHACDTFEEDTM